MQRDLVANIKVVDLGTIAVDGTGDDDGSVSLDTKGARSVTFVLDTATTLTTDVSYFQILESSDDGSSDAYAEIASGKYLPTDLEVEHATGEYGIKLINPTSPYKQMIGCFSTERYLKPRIHTDTSQNTPTYSIYAILEMADKPTTATWHPDVSDVDDEP
jgi:hypothetical protein